MTNTTVENAKGTLYYDGTCGVCTTWANRLRSTLARREIVVKPFSNGAAEPEMVLEMDNTRKFGGADAAIHLLKTFPPTYPLGKLFEIPPLHKLVHYGYKKIADNRHCNGKDSCAIDTKPATKPKGWLLLALLLTAAVSIGLFLELTGWIWMWLIAGANWLGFKLMSFRKAGGWRKVEWIYFAWPGMDAEGFLYKDRKPSREIGAITPTLFILVGILLGYLTSVTGNPYLKGWLGVAAMLCLLHFGSFVWLAGMLNRFGFAAEPIMRKPWLASGLGDFWSNRWNRAYSDWARDFLFYPFTRKFGIYYGTLAGFLASGLAHELTISIPARGGYGLPTLYFLIQGFGLLLAKRLKLRKRKLDRAWMWLVILIPAPLLFHRPFMENVFNPMTELLTRYL